MAVYRNENNGTWYSMVRYTDWKGERKQKCKRGFGTKREAQNCPEVKPCYFPPRIVCVFQSHAFNQLASG